MLVRNSDRLGVGLRADRELVKAVGTNANQVHWRDDHDGADRELTKFKIYEKLLLYAAPGLTFWTRLLFRGSCNCGSSHLSETGT